MTTPPNENERALSTLGVCLRTLLLLIVFAVSVAARPVSDHERARHLMAEAEQTANPIRLLLLASQIRELLDTALRAHPDDVEVRLDLMRFHAVTPRIAGGDLEVARAQAEEIASRDAALGHFARGYLAYRVDKQFGVARHEFKEAVSGSKNGTTRALALKWLGWLSQESQQWDDAFAAFEQLRPADVSALYEIARTSSFCGCELERGRAALAEYLRARPKDENAKRLAVRLR